MKKLVYLIIALFVLAACSHDPDYVIGEKDMVDLLVDVHKAEAVIESNYNQYSSKADKKKLREAVFLKHGITQEQFDTNLVWYGHHIEDYMKIYEQVVERLKAENEEKAAMITALQAELAQRDAQIKELDASIASLNSKLDALSNENKDQQDQLNAQDQALNTVFYTIGTKKELKAKGILEGGILKVKTLQGVVNDADFTKADLRNVPSIPLNVKKATLMTSHPEGSYTFVKEGKVITELSITNPEEFWSVSKYLVIRI